MLRRFDQNIKKHYENWEDAIFHLVSKWFKERARNGVKKVTESHFLPVDFFDLFQGNPFDWKTNTETGQEEDDECSELHELPLKQRVMVKIGVTEHKLMVSNLVLQYYFVQFFLIASQI